MGDFDKSTCWYQQDQIVAEMLKNYDVYLPLMDATVHIKTLKKIIELLPPGQNILDVGCGTAQISLLFKQHNYVGADMDFIILRVASVKHPENCYGIFNAEQPILDFRHKDGKKPDVILMNAFIDVMQYPLQTLEKVLQNNNVQKIILHRQEFTKTGETRVIKNPSYGGQTYHSIICIDDFYELIKKYNYQVMATHSCGFANWEDGGTSMLLQKI